MPPNPLPCPRCKVPLVRAEVEDHVVFGCGACGGVWLGPAEAEALRRKLGRGIADAADRGAPDSARPLDGTAYCPYDGLPLRRDTVSNVEIDACDHGTWFDAGEARRIFDLHKARRRRRQAERRQAAEAAEAERVAEREYLAWYRGEKRSKPAIATDGESGAAIAGFAQSRGINCSNR